MSDVIITECPRDAMQGIKTLIPTEKKIAYLNALLKVGFPVLDFGSYVSPKAIPQMADTAQVLQGLDFDHSNTKLLAIVANSRGAEEAAAADEITFLGYPFSISETFQQRNTNASIEESLGRLERIQNICVSNNKKLVVYLSMAFGNPYGDAWNADIATEWMLRLANEMNVEFLALSDTIGSADKESITSLFTTALKELPEVEIGGHLHATYADVQNKVKWAYEAGCRKFDGALKGLGGCPMAKDDLTGNMATEQMLMFFREINLDLGLDNKALDEALNMLPTVFP